MDSSLDEKKLLLMVRKIHRCLGLIVGILLFIHQLTIVGVFVTPRGFRLSLGGAITGTGRIESRTGSPIVDGAIYSIGFITAIMLIKDDFFVTGTVLQPHGFTINVSGPLFGLTQVVYDVPDILKQQDNFHDLVSEQLNLDKNIVKKYRRE